METDFPPEIVDLIFSWLDTLRDISSLRCCAAVDRNWRALARPRIFSHVMLRPVFNRSTHTVVHFHALLQSSPDLCVLVKDLVVDLGGLASLPDQDLRTAEEVFSSLVHIRSVTLRGRVHWGGIPLDIRHALRCITTQATRLEIDSLLFSVDMAVALTSLCGGINLKHLTLNHVECHAQLPEERVDEVIPPQCHLKSLSLTLGPSALTDTLLALQQARTPVGVSELEDISIFTSWWWNNAPIHDFLGLPSLKRVSYGPGYIRQQSSLISLSQVQRVFLTTRVMSDLPSYHSDIISWWAGVFSSSDIRSLEEIVLEIAMIGLDHDVCRELDTVISKLNLPVTIIAVQPHVSEDVIWSAFPSLRERNRLQIVTQSL
ncbi:hypothetical protein BDZ89DRAFT_1065333 [Hymenopellis radicata]|nr:hypothetical protein BDZ89DRAFT_1065333 [Hymenopellis radicata]